MAKAVSTWWARSGCKPNPLSPAPTSSPVRKGERSPIELSLRGHLSERSEGRGRSNLNADRQRRPGIEIPPATLGAGSRCARYDSCGLDVSRFPFPVPFSLPSPPPPSFPRQPRSAFRASTTKGCSSGSARRQTSTTNWYDCVALSRSPRRSAMRACSRTPRTKSGPSPLQTQRSRTAPACRACPCEVSRRASMSFLQAIVHNTERVRNRLKETQRPDGIGSSQREIRGRGSVEVSTAELAAGAFLRSGFLLGAEREPRQRRRVPLGPATRGGHACCRVGDEGRHRPRFQARARVQRLWRSPTPGSPRGGARARNGSRKFGERRRFGSRSKGRSTAYAS